jgi:hypothetical protein
MSTARRLARCAVLALLGGVASCAGPGANAPDPLLGPDVSAIRVRTAVPRQANPTYGGTVAWLATHARQHAHGTLGAGDKQLSLRSEISASRYGCVLLHTVTFQALSTGRHVTLGHLISLPEMHLSSIAVTSQTGRSACVNFAGEEGVVVEISVEPVREMSRSRESMICFDSRDAADRAAEALARVATLCGASPE